MVEGKQTKNPDLVAKMLSPDFTINGGHVFHQESKIRLTQNVAVVQKAQKIA